MKTLIIALYFFALSAATASILGDTLSFRVFRNRVSCFQVDGLLPAGEWSEWAGDDQVKSRYYYEGSRGGVERQYWFEFSIRSSTNINGFRPYYVTYSGEKVYGAVLPMCDSSGSQGGRWWVSCKVGPFPTNVVRLERTK